MRAVAAGGRGVKVVVEARVRVQPPGRWVEGARGERVMGFAGKGVVGRERLYVGAAVICARRRERRKMRNGRGM